ncbi:MAG: hypothetical protein WBP29_00800 [Candidatus Zixiibacteriota bacterium]
MAEQAEDTRVKDALELLNSYAKDKRTELQDILTNKYSHLKSAVGNVSSRIQTDAADLYGVGKEKAKAVAHDVDESVHNNPWAYIGGAALGALIIGYMLGRSKK